jgi:hypothetical protein
MNLITQEQALFIDISALIEQARHFIATHAKTVWQFQYVGVSGKESTLI